jgi:hypothetical protein
LEAEQDNATAHEMAGLVRTFGGLDGM